MIDISPEIITISMLGGVIIGVLAGYPFAFILGILAVVFGFIVFGVPIFQVLIDRVFVGILTNYILLAAPNFIFMGFMLERSGIAEKLYSAMYLWLGGIRGGLAIVTVIIGTIMAACVGIIAASITMLGVVALPSMIKRGYSKSLTTGSICAGGTLGILIPPSIMLVFYGPMAQISVGKLFFGAFGPGFLLSALYIIYIALRCFFQPSIAHAVPLEERQVHFVKKTLLLIISLLPTALLIMAVLCSIFFCIAPPTEVSAVGALASIVLSLAYRRLSLRVLYDVALSTLKTCGFLFTIIIMAYSFVGVFLGGGGHKVVHALIMSTPGGAWGAFAVIMFIIFILGMVIDWIGIVFIMVPIVTPIAETLGFPLLWFSIMVCVNLQMAFMTPPLAYAIFIIKGVAAPELGVTMGDVIRGVIPFVLLIILALVLMIIFPQIILWLPAQMIR